MKQIIPIVDENDSIITYKNRFETLETDICRVSSLWITNSKKEVLLAKRALTKRNNPGRWGPAVAGTVEKGESYKQNILKEAEEEIGLKNIHPLLGPKRRVSGKYNSFTQWFLLEIDKDIKDFKIQEEEVTDLKWFSKKEILKLYKQNPEQFITHMKVYVIDEFLD